MRRYYVSDEARFWKLLCYILLILLACSWIYYGVEYWRCVPCDETLTTVKRDTIPPKDTTLKQIKSGVPEAIKTMAKEEFFKSTKKKSHRKLEPVAVIPVAKMLPDPLPSRCDSTCRQYLEVTINGCDTVRIYSDTTHEANNYRIVTNDTVLGRILGHSVWFTNLKPEYRTTIEKVRKDRIRVYAGVVASMNIRHQDRWGIGPGALMAIPKVGAINYQYDIKNNEHTAGFYVLIRIKK